MGERVGFIGLGIMGSRMAANLRLAGFELTVWNRTTATAERWADEHGATVAGSPGELAASCSVAITMVVDADQVGGVLLGADGVASRASEGFLCIEMSTIGRVAARQMAARLAQSGIRFLDAPVTGSAPRAADGTLTIMVGGDSADVERARPLLAAMGELIVHVGQVGQGQMLKLINNSVAAANAATVGEALLVAARTDVPLDAVQRVLASGSGGSAMLTLKAQAMRDHDYAPLFKLAHMLKDVRLCLVEAERAGISFPAAARAGQVLEGAAARGLSDADFAALIEVLEADADTRL